jgi:hypothetical protein
LPHRNGRDERSRGRRLWFDIGVAARSRGASLTIRLGWHDLFVFFYKGLMYTVGGLGAVGRRGCL